MGQRGAVPVHYGRIRKSLLVKVVQDLMDNSRISNTSNNFDVGFFTSFTDRDVKIAF